MKIVGKKMSVAIAMLGCADALLAAPCAPVVQGTWGPWTPIPGLGCRRTRTADSCGQVPSGNGYAGYYCVNGPTIDHRQTYLNETGCIQDEDEMDMWAEFSSPGPSKTTGATCTYYNI